MQVSILETKSRKTKNNKTSNVRKVPMINPGWKHPLKTVIQGQPQVWEIQQTAPHPGFIQTTLTVEQLLDMLMLEKQKLELHGRELELQGRELELQGRELVYQRLLLERTERELQRETDAGNTQQFIK